MLDGQGLWFDNQNIRRCFHIVTGKGKGGRKKEQKKRNTTLSPVIFLTVEKKRMGCLPISTLYHPTGGKRCFAVVFLGV